MPPGRGRRHLHAAALRLRRLGHAGRGHARASSSSSTASSSRATGSRRPRRWPRSTIPDRERKPGSIGTPIEGVEMKAVDDDGNEVAQGDVGEIAIRGHNVMKGYWQRARRDRRGACATAGSTRGDMATVDDDGYFFIVDRKKEMIIRGGYNVYPREIEEVLYEHPAVSEAAVVGVPDDSLGEEVGAAIVLVRPGARRAPTRSARSSRSASPPTSTRARSGSPTSSRRARPGRSSSARSSAPARRLRLALAGDRQAVVQRRAGRTRRARRRRSAG